MRLKELKHYPTICNRIYVIATREERESVSEAEISPFSYIPYVTPVSSKGK